MKKSIGSHCSAGSQVLLQLATSVLEDELCTRAFAASCQLCSKHRRENSLNLKGNKQHANESLLTWMCAQAEYSREHVCVSEACLLCVWTNSTSVWMSVVWLNRTSAVSHIKFQCSVCTGVIPHFLSVCVCWRERERISGVWTCGVFCLRFPPTTLNPANLNSTEMVRIIRVWISASVLLLALLHAGLWHWPHCTVGDPPSHPCLA